MNKVTKTLVIIPSLILVIQILVMDLKDIQHLGCVWAKDTGLSKLCNYKKVQHLGCIWGVPGYMDETIDNNTGDRSFSFSSDFGWHKVEFYNISNLLEIYQQQVDDYGKITLVSNTKQIGDLTRKISIATRKEIFGVKWVKYTREGYKGEVEFLNMEGFPSFPQCRAK